MTKATTPAVLAVPAALLLLLATACGGGSSSHAPTAEEKTVISSVAKQITSTNGLLDNKAAQCVATKFVTEVGVKKLQSAKAVGSDDVYVADGALVDAATAAAYTKAVLACRSSSDVKAALVASSETGYARQTQGVMSTAQVSCLITRFVDTAGVDKLFSAHFVTDSGEFNGADVAYDNDTASKFADALVGCIDYVKLQAQAAVSAARAKHKHLDLAKLTTCLHNKISDSEIKAATVALLTGAPDARTRQAATSAKAQACQKVATK